MSHQFKVGDAAMIIAGANFGKTVELIYFLGSDQEIPDPFNKTYVWENYEQDVCWAVKPIFGGILEVFQDQQIVSDYACEPAKHLMPLRGDFTPEEEHEKQEIEA